MDLAEISKYWRFSTLSAVRALRARLSLLFRWKVTFPVLTFRSYANQPFPLSLPEATYLNIDLVSTKNNGDVLTNPLQISVPVGNVLVGDSGSNIEHDDTTLSLDVVTVSETTEFLLSSGIPDVEADGTEVGVESQRVDFDTESGWIVRFGQSLEGEGS